MNKPLLFLPVFLMISCSLKKDITIISYADLPKPIGPYNHSTSYGNLIFVSGQIGVDPKTNTLKHGIEEQTVQIFKNLKTILENNNSDLQHITKTTIFMTDIKQFENVNKIYSTYFNNRFPARSTIEVVALPMNAGIEIECIAIKKPF